MENRNTQGKRYGLQAPKKPTLGTVQPRLAVFGDDSDSEHEDGTDWVKKAFSKAASKNVQKKQTKLEIQRALKEDPTVYQYDEIYEQLEEKKQEAKTEKIAQERKPRYIQTLMAHAEKRKREQERRTERQVQKEREAEGEAFKDKEAFITASYRKKLEEFRILDEEERRMDELEAIGDVSKQKDLSGFYRHLYHQTLGENKPTIKQEKVSDGEQEAEVEKKQDEPDIKESIGIKKSDADSNISEGQESETAKAKEDHKERNATLPSKAEDKTYRTTVSHVTGKIAVYENINDTKEETSKNKPEEHDKNKRLPLSEISHKSVTEKHHANESNQDADTDITSSSSESDSDAENKANKSRRKKKEAFRSRQYRKRQSSSSSSSESENERSTAMLGIGTDSDSDESTERKKHEVEEKAPVLNTSPITNSNKRTNKDFSEAEKENKTNVRKENRREKAKVPDLSIYLKRTVGAKLEEARRKYLARKAAREAKNIFF